ncbi:RNA-directed DNA polymerase, eukaryota, reverse transcriptase zinc-binding domain protein [Tanacetum coccineum]
MVKNEFLNHFKNRFDRPKSVRPMLNMEFPHHLNSMQQLDLEAEVSNEEIKKAVWDCGVDKSPGPDGFTFDFYKRFWSLIEKDVLAAVKYFFHYSRIPKGCNSSFIALIPKTPEAKMVKDFRPISLIGSLYKIIAKILANRLVVVLGDIVNEVQSAFVADRQILDGPFILNEVLQWCKLKKKHSFILKIDFEKAYDSVRWDYLDDVLRKFGFGEKWCGWIQECLRSSWGSVLVNGSPTEEFQFFKGLKQGDPLSPFIFILVMESLHISFKRVVDAGMFNGIVLNSVMHLSHMFYADDAVFMGQWSTKNIDTIIYVLKCFHRASGLSINLSKSKLLGVVVSEDRVVQAANRIGCGVLKAPFAYLGSKVGGNMSRIKSWDEIVDKMVDRLSKWKMKTLSIGGRLTLLKAVLGSMPIYHMSIFKVPMKVLQRMESIRSRFFSGVDLNSKKSIWVKWSKVLCSKEKGGLGVSSLYALNRALMCKWVWRFTTQKNLLWTRVIKAIHGEDGKNGSGFKVGYKSIWRSILQEVETLKIKGIHLNNFMQKKLGNGADTYFWEDLWHGDMVLKQRYPRLYALEVKKTVDVASKLSQENLTWSFRRAPRSGVEQDQLTDLTTYVEGVVLGVTPDRWYWTLDGSGEFSVASARKVIDDNRFPEVSTQTRWIKAVPIKVNIHAWKVRMDCLPTRLNISRRGIDIPSILCPVCGSVTESSSHLFFDCLVAKDNFRKICRWWEVDFMEVHTFDEWVSWIVNLRIPIKHKRLLEGDTDHFQKHMFCAVRFDDWNHGLNVVVNREIRSTFLLHALVIFDNIVRLVVFVLSYVFLLWPSPEEARKQIMGIWDQAEVIKITYNVPFSVTPDLSADTGGSQGMPIHVDSIVLSGDVINLNFFRLSSIWLKTMGYKVIELNEDQMKGERSLWAQCQAVADMKFTYVVSCQKYGTHKRFRDPRAQNVLRLMTEYASDLDLVN